MYLISKIKHEQIPIDLLSGTGPGSLLGGSTSGQSGQGSLGSHSSHDVNYINNIYQNTNQTHLYVRSLFYKTRRIVFDRILVYRSVKISYKGMAVTLR